MAIRVGILIIALGVFALGSMLVPAWQSDSANVTQQCDRVMTNIEADQAAQLCNAPSEKVTWKTWFAGESRSSQFHFFDLLELLYQSSSSQTKDKPRSNEFSSSL